MKENVSSNRLKNVEIYELAVITKVGRVPFYQKGLSSAIVFEKGAKKFEVPTTSIDRFLNEEKIGRVGLINMDCEGRELLVLRGAEETLLKNKVKIFCKVHHDFLKQLGQSVEDIVQYLQGSKFPVQSVSSNELKAGNNFKNCEYIYATN